MEKKEIIEKLKSIGVAHLATVEDGKPRVRAMAIYRIEEDGIIIQTFKSKEVCRELEQSPEIELCFNSFDEGLQIRVRGPVKPMENEKELQEECLKERQFLKKFVDQGEEMAFFLMKDGMAHIWTVEKNLEPKSFVKIC